MSELYEKTEICYVQAASPATRILREDAVCDMTGLPKGTLRDLVTQKQFPEPIPIGRHQGRAVGWLSDEVFAWVNERITQRNKRIQASKGSPALGFSQQQTI